MPPPTALTSRTAGPSSSQGAGPLLCVFLLRACPHPKLQTPWQGAGRGPPTGLVVRLFRASRVGLQLLMHLESWLTFSIWVTGCQSWDFWQLSAGTLGAGWAPFPGSDR